ncbi:MAG: EAL domain-containing protein [Proteobacteria bacterium]|nr:EAL domain-containing protein [Pseudomonadota bacterium]
MSDILETLNIAAQIGLGSEEIDERWRFLEFEEHDVAVLKALHALLEPQRESFTDAFYDHLFKFAPLQAYVAEGPVLQQLKQVQARYFSALTEGDYGENYILDRLKVGMAHQRISLPPKWYLGAYRKYLTEIVDLLSRAKVGDTGGLGEAINALLKIVFFDMGIALDTYSHFESKRLRDSETRFKATFENAPVGVVRLDLEGRFLEVNRKLCEITGYNRKEMLGYKIFDITHEQDVEPDRRGLADLVAGKIGGFNREIRFVNKNAEAVWLDLSISLVRDKLGEPEYFVAMIIDISERKNVEQALNESEERFRNLTEISSDSIWEQDEHFRYTSRTTNLKFSGVPAESHVGITRWELPIIGISDEQWAAHRALLEAHLPFKNWEYQFRAKDGSIRWYSASGIPIFDDQGNFKGYRGVGRDITEKKRYQAELENQANHDALTGLANRLLLNDRLEHAIALAERHDKTVAVIFVDLDHFKDINDSLGHAVGDQLLQAVAKKISACVRDVDTVARPGGDEFVLVLAEDQTENDAMVAIGRIMSNVSGLYHVAGLELHVSCSIGASLYPKDGRDAGTLLMHADTAMYRAKDGGRNRYAFYRQEMNTLLRQRLTLEAELRHAVERRELLLHYQPQIDLNTGAISGMEALIRWQHPERGMVPPDEFISIAEESGLIVPIGEWVLNTACAQAREWREAGISPIRMAVNISARQFRHKAFVDSIHTALSANDLAPYFLELEITESMAVDNPEETILLLQKLNATGLSIAMDDFGTGFSSLSYLKRLPISVLKIDRSFINGIVTDPSDVAIAKTVIDLGRNLGMQIVAEGVETVEQARLLQGWNCNTAQGYYRERVAGRHQHSELGATSIVAVQADRQPQGIGQTLGAEQAQAESFLDGPFGVETLKRVKRPFDLLLGHAAAGIPDDQTQPASAPAADQYPVSPVAIADGVGERVADDALKVRNMSRDGQSRRHIADGELLVLRSPPILLDQRRQHGVESHRLQGRAMRGFVDRRELLDVYQEIVDLLERHIQLRRVRVPFFGSARRFEQLYKQADPEQGLAQVVIGGRKQQAALVHNCRLLLLLHHGFLARRRQRISLPHQALAHGGSEKNRDRGSLHQGKRAW